MVKVNRVQSALLITALIVTTASALPSLAVIRQQPQQQITSNSKYLALSWGDIVNIFRRRRVPGGSRGNLCAIAPGTIDATEENIERIWSLNPLFLWQIQNGRVEKIQLLSQDSKQVLWNPEIKPGQTQVIYNGKPLESGQTYQWKVNATGRTGKVVTGFNFKVLPAEQRDRITQELKQLEETLKKQGANSEKITLEKVNYFAQRELWTDALKEIYSVENPSRDLKQLIQQIQITYCPQPSV